MFTLDKSRACVTPNFTTLAGQTSSPITVAGELAVNGYTEVNSLTIDFDDGNGAQAVALSASPGDLPSKTVPIDSGGSPTTVTYTVAGIYKWRPRVTLANGESFLLSPITVTVV